MEIKHDQLQEQSAPGDVACVPQRICTCNAVNCRSKGIEEREEMKKLVILLIFVLVTLLSFSSIGFALYPSASPWITYRHDATHSGATSSNAPDTNNTLWTWGMSAASLSIVSTPLIADGKVIFQVQGLAVAVDETTGVELWRHQTSGQLTASAYADGRVFFGIYEGSGGIVCLNTTTGEEIWKVDTSPNLVTSSPLVYRGMVYAGASDNGTYAIEAATGHYKWGYMTNGSVYSSPAADGDLLFFGSDDAKLYALNVSGSMPTSLWNFTANGAIRSTPTIDSGRIFFGSDNNMLYAVNEATGELIWSWATSNPAVRIRNGMAVANNILYVTSEDLTKIYALHADVAPGNYTDTDLTIRYWTKELAGVLHEPVYANGKIIVACTGGDPAMLYALDADVGTTLWDRGWKWWPNLGNPVVADGRLWNNVYWDGDSYSYTLYCTGAPFPPSTTYYIVNAGGSSFAIALETNSTTTNFNTAALETEGKISFNVQGIGTTDMCNITLPDTMLSGPFNVTVDGEQPVYMTQPASNGTHTSLYFTYNDTIPHTVEITGTNVIPEFPATAVLPMLITTLLMTLVQVKRKHNK
jgi:outer membrane protein assembly factor BamB